MPDTVIKYFSKHFLIRVEAGPTLHSSVIQIHFPGLSVEEMLPHTQHCPDSPCASPLKWWQQTNLQIPPKVTLGERHGSKQGGAEGKRENWPTFSPTKDGDLSEAFFKIFFLAWVSVCKGCKTFGYYHKTRDFIRLTSIYKILCKVLVLAHRKL